MTLDQIRKNLISGKQHLWWSLRFLETVGKDLKSGKKKDLEQAASCFVKLALADPEWALDLASGRGRDSHRLTMVLSSGRLASILPKLKIKNVRLGSLLRAQLLSSSALWGRKRSDGPTLLRKAWKELQRIPESERDDQWKRLARAPSAEVDYPVYLALSLEAEAKLETDFDRSHFLPGMIAVASRHKDWATFERCIATFRALPEALVRDHSAVAIANYEGLHALDEGRLADAESAMRLVLELAPVTPFLSNDETSALAKRLRAESRNLELCDAFDALVKQRDWRILKS